MSPWFRINNVEMSITSEHVYETFPSLLRQIVSDPVGYGFVIRGSRPVYIHTIDPSGPAAAAGLEVSKSTHAAMSDLL